MLKYRKKEKEREKKVVEKKQFDDNENPVRDIRRMQSFICLYSTLFMSFGISEIYSPIDQARATEREWMRVRVEWTDGGAAEVERELRASESEPFAKYLFMRGILTMYGRKFHIVFSKYLV